MRIVLSFLIFLYIDVGTPTKVRYHPLNVIKRNPVTLTCETDNPESNATYKWLKNGHELVDIKTQLWTIPAASVETRVSSFTCIVETTNGSTSQASVFIKVTAPPAFIKPLPPYRGFLYTSKDISLTCRIECFPTCSIIWFKDGNMLNTDKNRLYYVINKNIPADVMRNDFESVESSLIWNLTNWPNKQLDRNSPMSVYSCGSQSDRKDVRNINSTAYVNVEYPPVNLTLSSNALVNINEGEVRKIIVRCEGYGVPRLSYTWTHKPTGLVVAKSDGLYLDKISRSEIHNYTCEGYNRHGNLTVDISFNVLYKPNCSLQLDTFNDEQALVCSADANPENVTFFWTFESLDHNAEYLPGNNENGSSFVILTDRDVGFGTYKCLANNSLGVGVPCEKTLPGNNFKVELFGVEDHVLDGTEIELKCKVLSTFDVEISWYNGSKILNFNNSTDTKQFLDIQMKSGFLTTTMVLVFTASRWQNNRRFKCSVNSSLMEKYQIPPEEKNILLNVFYAPVVTLSTSKLIFEEEEKEIGVLSCEYSSNPAELQNVTWWKRGKKFEKSSIKYKYNKEKTTLTITNVTREDAGEYSCWLRNDAGEGKSQTIFIDVKFRPSVEVMVEPCISVTPFQAGNITLTCKMIAGNPLSLDDVMWFVNDVRVEDLARDALKLKRVIFAPDPSILILNEVNEDFLEKFSCRGANNLGFGPRSRPQIVSISYPNVPFKLTYKPSPAIKGKEVTLQCLVVNLEIPKNLTYIWFRNGHRLNQVSTPEWTIPQASLDTRNKFRCLITNGRLSSSADAFIEVLAPPDFVKKPASYKGVLRSSQFASITCRIECYPYCYIIWSKNGVPLDSSALETVKNIKYQARAGENLFESVESTLTFPTQGLTDNDSIFYTCSSSPSKFFGSEVNASVEIRLEFPPENVITSTSCVNVNENGNSDVIKCSGDGIPALTFIWKKASSNETIAYSNMLYFSKISKSQQGNYICEGFNKHGKQTANVYINVNYRPICSIDIGYLNNQQVLICKADANPKEVLYIWKAASLVGETQVLNSVDFNFSSYLIVNLSLDFSQKYRCYAENSLGFGNFCETSLPVPPSSAILKYYPLKVMKNDEITLECVVDEPGFPPDLTYLWFRNQVNIQNTTVSKWSIKASVGTTVSTFTCLAINKAGSGKLSNPQRINVVAPPAFVEIPVKKTIINDSLNSLTCRIECQPLCSIIWFKDFTQIDFEENDLYFIDNETYEIDYEKNIFESISSTLMWNTTVLPGDVYHDSTGYTCASFGVQNNVQYTIVV